MVLMVFVSVHIRRDAMLAECLQPQSSMADCVLFPGSQEHGPVLHAIQTHCSQRHVVLYKPAPKGDTWEFSSSCASCSGLLACCMSRLASKSFCFPSSIARIIK